jgi:YgiT-type zinc finger domain-containing protein
MRCAICRQGETRSGTATLVLERDGRTVIVKHVPAQVCENCGEEYVDEATAGAALDSAERAVSDGAEVVIREYAAA